MPDNSKTFHIFVDKEKIDVDANQLTGLQIKQLAGVPITDLLEEEIKDEPVAINDEQSVEIKNGLHFRTHPGGKDS